VEERGVSGVQNVQGPGGYWNGGTVPSTHVLMLLTRKMLWEGKYTNVPSALEGEVSLVRNVAEQEKKAGLSLELKIAVSLTGNGSRLHSSPPMTSGWHNPESSAILA
jgi:hypothetical protein